MCQPSGSWRVPTGPRVPWRILRTVSSDRHPPKRRAATTAGRYKLREDRRDERERQADRREALADEREREADRREALADEREARANERESEASLREKRLDERERSVAVQEGSCGFQQHLLRTIEQTRASLAAGSPRHHGPLQAAAGDLAAGAQHRHEWADHDRDLLTALLREAIQQAKATREHTHAVIEALAATKEAIARQYDELAAAWPHHADKYQQLAERARASAQRSYRTLRNSSEPGIRPVLSETGQVQHQDAATAPNDTDHSQPA